MKPLSFREVEITDAFWLREMQLVRETMLPYQWEVLNDRVPGATKSWWMRNMRAAARAVQAKKAGAWQPRYAMPEGMVTQPADENAPEPDRFYGWVFQDSDGYKWVEAVSYQLMRRPDEALQRMAQEAVDAICAAQEEDGYLDTWYTLFGRERAFTNLRDHHELYCFGHLAEAAVAWHQATGQRDLLDAACRFADCIDRRFGPEGVRGCPGHEIAEMALCRLWAETGEKRWLALAGRFIDVRGTKPNVFWLEENARRAAKGQPPLDEDDSRYTYHQANRPLREADEAVGHAVRQMYLLAGMADVARLNGDEALAAACGRLWRSVTEEKMYVTGGVGGTHVGEAFSRAYDLPSDTAYSETCAAVALVFSARRMMQLNGQASCGDVLERALYNTVLAGVSLSGTRFFYVNPLEVDPAACRTDARLGHVKPVRQPWFSCACCPPNAARLISDLPEYIYLAEADRLWVSLYIGSHARVSLGGQPLAVRLDCDLMRGGDVTLTIEEGAAAGEIIFRLPSWSARSAWTLPEGISASEEDDWLRCSGRWQAGMTLRLCLDMTPRALCADPRVRETAGEAAFQMGPLVMCAEEADNGPNLHLLRVDPEAEARPARAAIGGLDLPALRCAGRRLIPDEAAPLYRPWQTGAAAEPAEITLVPYFAWNNRQEGEMRVWLRT